MKAFCFAYLILLSATIMKAGEDRLVIGAEAKKGVGIVDPSNGNELLWHRKIDQVHDLHLLDNDHILTQDGWTTVVEFNLEKEIVWKYDATSENRKASDGKVEIHAYQRLPGGLTMIAESGPGRIIEVDREGKIVTEMPLQVSKPSPHSDTRLVRKLASGNYLVCHEADQVVKEYSPEGKVVWELPIPLFGKPPAKGHGPEAFGGKCFSATVTKNGNYLIGTGNGHSVLEVTPDKEIVWKIEQRDLDGIVLAWVTNVSELANGNIIIGNCHAGPDQPQIIEVTKDKEVVWTFNDFENFGNALANTLVIDGKRARELRAKLAN